MFKSLRKSLALVLAVAGLAVVSACSSVATSPPSPAVIAAINNACAVDATQRPVVTALLALPGLATPNEVRAVELAREVIDPICAAPSESVAANASTILALQSAKIMEVVEAVRQRQKPATPGPAPVGPIPSAPAAPSSRPTA